MKCRKSSNTYDRRKGKPCPTNSAICGMELEIEPPQGSGSNENTNDAAMTGAKFLCCPLPETNIPISQSNAISFNTNCQQGYNYFYEY